MPHDEALGLAQLLLGLLLFTVGIPALLVEIRVDEPLRRLLHKRIRPLPMIVLGFVSLLLVVALIGFSGENIGTAWQRTLRALGAAIIVMFAIVWLYIYMNVRISLVVNDIVSDLKARLRKDGTISNHDLADLLLLGENLEGDEKSQVIFAVGELISSVQSRSDYNGSRMEALIRGLPRIVEMKGTIDHHNAAMQVISASWRRLVSLGFADDKDADFIQSAACALGTMAVGRQLESVALRWVSTFPVDVDATLTIEVPYRIGAAAVGQRQYAVGVAALNQLTLISRAQNRMPREFIALVAHFHAAGPSAGRRAREFIDRLEYAPRDVRLAAENAISAYRKSGSDYVTADVIESFLHLTLGYGDHPLKA